MGAIVVKHRPPGKNKLKRWLMDPTIGDLEIDDPEVTHLHGQIIRKKPFLELIYREWYESLAGAIPEEIGGSVLELGSGGGFLYELIPQLIRSEVLY